MCFAWLAAPGYFRGTTMTKTLLRTTALSLALLPLTATAFAQDTGDSEIEDVIVVRSSPIRDSQAAAIAAKRNADNVVDIIAADTIGRFPDQNLADSLGRVPGLAIERDQGQARFINFRGAPFRYTSIAFDGIDVLGAEDGRTPRFDAFPSVITSQIEVNKAITPDMPGSSVAGFINIGTFNPFDRAGLSFSAEVGQGNQELGDVDIEKYNGRISFSNDKVGVLVFGSHNLRGRITDNREYELTQLEDGSIVPDNLDFRSYRGEREDNAYGGTFEVRPTDSKSRIFFSTLYSEFIDREERNQFDFDITDGHQAVTGDASLPDADVGYEPLILVTRLLEDGEYTNSTFTNTLGWDSELGDWLVEGRINYTETENTTDIPLPFSAGGQVAGSYDVTDILDPQLVLFDPFTTDPLADINDLEYASTFLLYFASKLDSEAWKGKFDASRDVTMFGSAATVKLGAQADFREADGGSALAFDFATLAGAGIDPADFATSTPWSSDFSNTINATDYDNVGLQNAIEAAGVAFPEFDPDSAIAIEENIYAAYGMVTFDKSWGSLVVGARVEATDFETTGNQIVDGEISPVEASNDYVHVLPSLHLNVDVSENTKARFSVTSGVSRPNYNELRASVAIDPTETPYEAEGGNPDLDAEFAWGFDGALEWYFSEASLFSVGAFARFIDNVIYPDTVIIEDGSFLAPGLIPEGTAVARNSFFNGENGELYGLEFNFIGQATFLPGALSGLGATANVTFLDSSFDAPTRPDGTFDLPGTSDLVYNASVFFEKFGLSARVNYQYRDAWLSTTENDSLTEFWGETERVDASIRYEIPSKVLGSTVTLFADGNNLTDEQDLRYVNSPATPNQYEGFGRRYTAGLRIDY